MNSVKAKESNELSVHAYIVQSPVNYKIETLEALYQANMKCLAKAADLPINFDITANNEPLFDPK